MPNLIDLKDLQLAIDTPIASKEKILEMLGDWRPVLTTDDMYYSEHKLTPATCENCGGRVDKDTMTCCYCGTFYR
jgi:hypothetical protein